VLALLTDWKLERSLRVNDLISTDKWFYALLYSIATNASAI